MAIEYIDIYEEKVGNLPLTGNYHMIRGNTSEEWIVDQKHHREDGPACICYDGRIWYMLNGYDYTKKAYYTELYKRGLITEQECFIVVL